jgi:RNA polymerase subunit RPABC4/transcription elongation factor Spt4
MLQCQNCGQVNNQNSNFCRFCGTKFMSEQHQNGSNYEFSPPRPYAWKTDEFQISESRSRRTDQINLQKPQQVQPLGNPYQTPNAPQPLAFHQPQNLAQDYRCPRCSSQLYPRFERKISQAGWITFAVLLVAFFPLFWIGLLIKEDVRVCPVCGLTIGSN